MAKWNLINWDYGDILLILFVDYCVLDWNPASSCFFLFFFHFYDNQLEVSFDPFFPIQLQCFLVNVMPIFLLCLSLRSSFFSISISIFIFIFFCSSVILLYFCRSLCQLGFTHSNKNAHTTILTIHNDNSVKWWLNDEDTKNA